MQCITAQVNTHMVKEYSLFQNYEEIPIVNVKTSTCLLQSEMTQ